MIPFDRVRQAERNRILAQIAAQPSSAVFERLAAHGGARNLIVRITEPQKSREMKQGGFDPRIDTEAWLVLDIGAPPPVAAKEFIGITDLGGEFRNYSILSVTPLRGEGCYRLGLHSRASAGTAAQPPRLF